MASVLLSPQGRRPRLMTSRTVRAQALLLLCGRKPSCCARWRSGMAFKFGKIVDEMCYPFMYESSSLCDFEVITDELCGHIGAISSHLPEDMPDMAADLEQIQPLAFHINGSIRGRLAVSEEDQAWLQQRLNHYRQRYPNA